MANDNFHSIQVKIFQMYSWFQLKFYCPPDLQMSSSLFLYTNFLPTSTPLIILGSSRWSWVMILWTLIALETEYQSFGQAELSCKW